MDKTQKLSTIMSAKLISLHPKDKLERAEEIFKKYDLHHIVIEVDSKLVGIMSLGDLLFFKSLDKKSKDRLSQVSLVSDTIEAVATIDQVMISHPITINLDASIGDCINQMIKHRINALPVVDGEKLVGLITTFDILKSI